MSNSYGFDFLRNEHQLNETGDGPRLPEAAVSSATFVPMNEVDFAAAANKPDLEKQFDILAFLQKHRGSGSCLAPALIYRATGIDLEAEDSGVGQMLQANPKVRTELIPDAENPALLVAHYAYQAKYPTVRDRSTLLAQVNRMHCGVPVRDLLDSYDGIAEHITALITAGDVISVANSEDKDKILFPRGETFLVELDGMAGVPSGRTAPLPKEKRSPKMDPNGTMNGAETGELPIHGAEIDVDPRNQIRRGEAVQVGGQWFRVSSAVRPGVPLSEQPARAQAPQSVVSLTDLSDRNEKVDGYTRPFSARHIPLDAALSTRAQENLKAARTARELLLKLAHGRSGGVTGQLTGSYAHSSNPIHLAKSFASANPHFHNRKRPNKSASNGTASTEPLELSKEALERAAADPALAVYSHARRHGVTRDVRDMYFATRDLVPESDHDLLQELLKHKLLEPGEQMRRPRLVVRGTNVDNDGKPKKRRYYERKNQRMTNTHLEGTEIGAILARAAEKQKQGKSVGDGGM